MKLPAAVGERATAGISHLAVLQDKLREIGKPKTVGDRLASDLALGRMLGAKKCFFCETKPIRHLESTKKLFREEKKPRIETLRRCFGEG